jgi:hypothetical protein
VATAQEIADAIATDAVNGIQSVTVAGQNVTKMSVDDQIKAANFQASRGAALQPHFGLRMTKLVPPGAG